MTHDDFDIRFAVASDLPSIVRLLVDDELGAAREDASKTRAAVYEVAFEAIEKDPKSCLLVAVSRADVVACLQLTIIPGLSHRGAMRCQIEGIRVLRALRGLGIGTALLKAAEKWAVANGCSMLQLLVHRDRSVAQRFYHALGFEDMHLGLRKPLRPHGALNPRGD